MNWFWIVSGILIFFLWKYQKRKRQKEIDAKFARELDQGKYENKKQLHYEENSAIEIYDTPSIDGRSGLVAINDGEKLGEISDQLKITTVNPVSKKDPSYNDIIEEKIYHRKLKQEGSLDPFNGISIEKISTTLHGLRNLIGKDKCSSNSSDKEYEVDMGQQTCNCEIFSKKSYFPINDARRFCYHMIEVFERRDAFDLVDHRAKMVAYLGSAAPVVAAYALQHIELPLMYLLVEEENPWLSIYGREKRSGETIYNASGDFMRHGYNILEHRWAYGSGVMGVSLLRPFLKSINKLEDIDGAVNEIIQRSPKLNLASQIDPRLNPNLKSDQYGPERDAYEIPESALTDEYPFECGLLFSYIDGRGEQSRRTVDFKKIQFYGSEGSFLYGDCRMRKAGRTFNTNKMTDVIDIETGEVIENVREYAEKFWQESAKAKLLDWSDNNDRLAKAFLFLLKGNKRATKEDYRALSLIFSEILDGTEVTNSDIQYLYSDRDPTTAVGFQRLVGGILKHHPDQATWFKHSAEKIVNARAKPNFADQAALQYVNERIL